MRGRSSRDKALELVARIPDMELRKEAERSLRMEADLTRKVEVFHKLYGLPVVQTHEARLDFSHITKKRLALRFALIAEEFIELCRAMDIEAHITYSFLDEDEDPVFTDSITEAIENTEERNIVEVADACADLKYVITGFELEVGIPGDAVLSEVQASNLSKLGEDGKPIYREDGKVLKGPNYFKADVGNVLKAMGLRLGPVFGLNLKTLAEEAENAARK